MFGDDFFDEIERAFFGQPGEIRRTSTGNVLQGEREERVIDYIEEDNNIYFVFELAGYSEEDINVSVNGKELNISANKRNFENVQDYLSSKLSKGIYFRKTIPNNVKAKKFDWTFKNGILEVKFKRK
jgi:HSP20 family molecular chaperone IbpA